MPHPYTGPGWQPPPLLPAAQSALSPARRRAQRVEEAAARADLQRELRQLVGRVQGLLAGRGILELACGSGWWTRHLAQAGQGVLAVDDDADLVRQAAAGGRFPAGRVRFAAADLTALERLAGPCDAGFAALLTSGLGEAEAAAVLAAVHRRLGPGAQVVLVDEREASGGDDAAVRRRLRDLAPDAQRVKLDLGPHFWCLCYTL
ncbi:class I SAM-dependent methyltransferase [Caenispirillum bisanense]|uniref:class I SAM-dependent methyltransferase n=1 Tax=Caenispirillum bisanense TaxID=414052 RepID=UPI0031DEE93E